MDEGLGIKGDGGKREESVALVEKKKFDVVDGYLEGGTGGSVFDYRETASQKQVHPGGAGTIELKLSQGGH